MPPMTHTGDCGELKPRYTCESPLITESRQLLLTCNLIFVLHLRFNGHSPGESELAGFIGAKDDEGGSDNWSYTM